MALNVSSLTIYPIKSLMGVRQTSAKVEQRGLQYDRRWMLVDNKNQFLSQRQKAEMVFLHTAIDKDHLLITDIRSNLTYRTPLINEIYKDKIWVTIWDDEVEALEISSEANEWFSDILDKEVKLVYMPDTSHRPISSKWAINEETVSFADGYPLLIASRASLDSLNDKLDESITMERFRPNIVVEGAEPNEEFLWKEIKISGYEYQCLKPCERCQVTTIDPQTGEKGREPLLTLSKNKLEDKIVFGQHAYVKDHAGAVIRIGDPVQIISKKSEPYESL